MVTRTRGIVIKYLKFRETSIIVQIFTEDYGLTSFIVQGIRSSKSKRSIGYFQPLSLLDLIAYIKPNREIHQLSEYKFYHPTHQIQHNIKKSTIALFLSEILGKLLQHEPDDEHKQLFRFLSESIMIFDALEGEIENFHIHFLLKLMPYMGIGIQDGDTLVHSMELEMIEQDVRLISFISAIIASPFDATIEASGNVRFKAIELILRYLQHHTAQFGEIKSLKVLHQVFS